MDEDNIYEQEESKPRDKKAQKNSKKSFQNKIKKNNNNNNQNSYKNKNSHKSNNNNTHKNKRKSKKNFKKKNSKKQPEFTSTTYKTKVCEFYKKGACKRGDDCTFSHNYKMKQLDEVCRFFLTGNCLKTNCLFSHDLSTYPCKYFFLSGKCKNMLRCQFSHQKFFKGKKSILSYIDQHKDSILKHWKGGFRTPLLIYAVDGGFVEEEFGQKEVDMAMMIPGIGDDDDQIGVGVDDEIGVGGDGDDQVGVGAGDGVDEEEDTVYMPF